MDDKTYDQACNVTTLPGRVKSSCAMSGAHWGYVFPIGDIAAFDVDEGCVISTGALALIFYVLADLTNRASG
ncbi:MAG: RtcB family protein [Gammaproteobacteria bacterium]|nr:RtcB family protein [Gammaproteobacteria bacterium]